MIKMILRKIEENKKKKAMQKFGRYVDKNGVVYFDPTRWVSATKMRKYC